MTYTDNEVAAMRKSEAAARARVVVLEAQLHRLERILHNEIRVRGELSWALEALRTPSRSPRNTPSVRERGSSMALAQAGVG